MPKKTRVYVRRMQSASLVSMIAFLLVTGQGLFISAPLSAAEQTAVPDFGPNVLVFDSSMNATTMQSRLDAVFSNQERNQFGTNRYALLFKPGKYDLDVQVGFYTQVMGLGKSPDDVAITGAVRSKARWMRGNATCNFWRSAENLSVTPTQDDKINIWAVSQGTALRRIHIRGDLNLSDGGWSSGGFLADSKIDGRADSGSQQQWFSRNTSFGHWTGGVWNMVFLGTVNPPAKAWPNSPYTVIDKTPLIREKPYLFVDDNGRYFVMVPDLAAKGAQGITWSDNSSSGKALPLDRFYVAHPETDTAATINAALKSGKNLMLTPGNLPSGEQPPDLPTRHCGSRIGLPHFNAGPRNRSHDDCGCRWCEGRRNPF